MSDTTDTQDTRGGQGGAIRATLTVNGNLARDPYYRQPMREGGQEYAELRVVHNTRRKDPSTGAWHDAGSQTVSVTLYGAAARAVRQAATDGTLRTGTPVFATGRLTEPDTWTGRDGRPHITQRLVADRVGVDLLLDTVRAPRHAAPGTDTPSMPEPVDPQSTRDDDPWEGL